MEPSIEDFTRLFDSSYRTIERYIRQRVNDRELAEDLVGETFARALEKHLTGTSIGIRWLLRTARNLIGNEYQRRATRQRWMQQVVMEELSEVATWDGDLGDVELRQAMTRLPTDDALALHLIYWEGLSTAEVAAYMGCTTGALWTRLSRARALLRAQLSSSEVPQPTNRPAEEGAGDE